MKLLLLALAAIQVFVFSVRVCVSLTPVSIFRLRLTAMVLASSHTTCISSHHVSTIVIAVVLSADVLLDLLHLFLYEFEQH